MAYGSKMSYKRVISNCKKLGLVFKVKQSSSFKYEIIDKVNKLRWSCKNLDECCEAIFQAKTMIEAQASSSMLKKI